jgi:hypothetical protein
MILLLVILTPVVGIGSFYGYRWVRLQAALADQEEIATVLDSYISRLQAKDAAGAQQLLCRNYEGEGATQTIESMLAKSHLYENYKSIRLDNVQVTSHRGYINAAVSGIVEYESGSPRGLTSRLRREGDTWRVNGFKIEESAAEKDAADER